MPDFIVIKSEECTSDQESEITVALIWNGGVTSSLTLSSMAALMTGTDADLETAFSYLGNGLMQVVTSADEFLPGDYGPDALELMRGATNLLDPALADALANPPGAGGQWEFGGDCAEGDPMKPLRPMLGRTAVALVFVEGPGTAAMDEGTRVSAYANTAAGLGVLGRLGAAWGARLNPPLSSPPATFALTGRRVPIGVDPRSLPGRTGNKRADWQAIDRVWLDATLDALGVPAGGTFDERMRKVGAALAAIGWTWLGVDDVVPVFMTNYPTYWDGYADGAHRYATIDVRRVWATEQGREHLVIAHELGHLFGAPDEYDTSTCTVADTTGPFTSPNLNCSFVSRTPPIPNPLSVSCLMKDNAATACPSTELSWGWLDADLDGEPDLLKRPEITGVEPMAQAPGQLIALTGRNMWDVVEVDFGGTRSTDIYYVTVDGGLHPLGEADGSVKYRTDQIQVRVPAGLDGLRLLSVRTRGNTWSLDDQNVFVAVTSSGPVIITEPVVQQLIPPLGAAGLEVTIKGEHLALVSSVTVGGTPAPNVQAWTGQTVTFTVPARPPGPAQVVVSTPTESSVPWAFSEFTVL